MACENDGSNSRAGNLPETISVKEAAPACELLLHSDEVTAKEADVHLSIANEAKARGAALALGEVQYPVRQQARGGVIIAADSKRLRQIPNTRATSSAKLPIFSASSRARSAAARVSGAANPRVTINTCARVRASSSSRASRSGDSVSFLINSRPCCNCPCASVKADRLSACCAGARQILHRLVGIGAAAVMMRQFGQMLLDRSA